MFKQLIKNANTIFFRRFLLSYLAILVVTFILSIIVYNFTLKVVEENAIESRISMMKQARDIIDKHLQELDEMVIQIAFDPKLNKLLYIYDLKDGSPDVFYFWYYAKELKYRTLTTNVFKSTFYILLDNNNYIFSHDNTYWGFQKFYKDVLSYEDIDYDTWYEELFNRYYNKTYIPARRVTVNQVNKNVITYVCPLPLIHSENKPEGVIIFLIEEDDIKKQFLNLIYNNRGYVTIVDGSDIILGVGNYEEKFKNIILNEKKKK
mgnify:FL=1